VVTGGSETAAAGPLAVIRAAQMHGTPAVSAADLAAPVRLAVLIALSVMSDAQEMVPGRRRADSLFQAVGRWA
jgi:hypothetical protein